MSADLITAENFGRNSFNKEEGDDGGGFMALVDHRVGQYGCNFLHKLALREGEKSASMGIRDGLFNRGEEECAGSRIAEGLQRGSVGHPQDCV